MFDFSSSANITMDAVEKIYDRTKGSALNTITLQDCEAEIKLISKLFGCSEEQAVLLSILVQSHFENNTVSTKEILDHADLKTSAAAGINTILAPLVEKEWISAEKDVNIHPLTQYQISNELIKTIITEKLVIKKEITIDNSFQLITCFQSKLAKRCSRKINYNFFIENTYQLIQDNDGIELSDFILKLKMNPEETALYMYLCSKFFLGIEEIDWDEVVRELAPPKECCYQLRKALENDTNFLIKNGLVTRVEKNDFFSGFFYKLTEKGIRGFDKQAKVKNEINNGKLQQLEPNTITPKKLIFDPNDQKMVDKLEDMLSLDNFTRLTHKLESQGMKKGISVLLYGHPGTGKTETVMQLGKNSSRYIMMVDASKIRSKWVGETEKNMKEVFDEYKKATKEFDSTPILLFNEADGLIGKRHTVSDRGDQMENATQNILLQELENFEGIFFATTNLVDNLDKAFDRRFLYKIRFEKPGANTLLQIWKAKFPEVKPNILKKIGAAYSLSGGQIENIRKKITVDKLLEEQLVISESYLHKMCEQELMLEKKNVRTAIGFLR